MSAGPFGAGLINIFLFGSRSDSLLPMHTAAKEDGQPFAELNKQINKVKMNIWQHNQGRNEPCLAHLAHKSRHPSQSVVHRNFGQFYFHLFLSSQI